MYAPRGRFGESLPITGAQNSPRSTSRLVLYLCSEVAISLQVSAMLVPCTIGILIWRSVAMICSELNLSFSVLSSLVAGQFSQSTCSGATLTVRG